MIWKRFLISSLLVLSLFSYIQQIQPEVYAQSSTTEKPKEAFYCGAMTKAGKPCKKRVKKQGDHCWMHQNSK